MAIGSIGGDFKLLQSYLSSGLSLNKYVSSLMDAKKTGSSTGSSYINESLFQQLGAIDSNAINLQSQIGRMASLTQYSAGSVKSASYSTEGILSASVAKNAPLFGYTKSDVTVSQLASGQQNRSAALDANENSFGSQFSIDITDSAGKTSQFSVDLTEQDNNKTAMQAMADEINAANIGIKATLAEDKANGTVSMRLSGEKTGQTNGLFTVTDGSAANLGSVDSAARDAIYLVNGVAFSSQSNEVKIMDGVTATLKTTGSTQISYTSDFSPAFGEVQKFLDTFNNLLDAASDSPLKRQLNDVMLNSVRGLGYSGIGIDSGGKLSITDTGKLNESISNGSFARNFQGPGSFGQKLYDVTLNAHSTVYNSALKESFNDLLSGLMDNYVQSAYGDQQNGTSFFPGLIFSIWA